MSLCSPLVGCDVVDVLSQPLFARCKRAGRGGGCGVWTRKLYAIDDETDPEFACCFDECKRAYVVDSNVFKNFG